MAYESSIPFADIRDFREAEINGIPALFTMSRLDSETLPADFHSCEVMGGRGSDFSVARSVGSCKLHRNVRLPAALAPGRTGIRRNTPVRHHDATTVDEWSENNNDNS